MARFLAQRDVGPWQERIAREEFSPAARSSPALPPDGAVERCGSSQLNADNLRLLEKQVATAGPVPPPAHLPPHQTLAKGLLQEEPGGAFRLRFGRRPAPPRPSRQPPAPPHPALVPNALGMPSAVGAAALVSGDSSSSSRRLESRQRRRRDGVDSEGRGPTSSGEYGRGGATVTGIASSHNRVSASSFVGPRGEASRADVERQLREQARLHEELVGNRGLAQPPSVGGATSQRQQHRKQLQFQQPSSRGGTGAAGSAYRAGSSSQYGGGAAMSAGEAAALAEEMEARVKMLEAHIAEERDSRDEVKERLAKLATLLEREAQQQPAASRGTRPVTGGGGGAGVSGTASSSRFAVTKRLPVPRNSTGGRPPTGGAPKRQPTTLPAEPARQPPKVASSAQAPSSAVGSRRSNGGVMTSSAAQLSSQHLTW